MEDETKERIKAIFNRIDKLSSNLHKSDFKSDYQHAMQIHEWKVNLGYEWGQLSNELSLLTVEANAIADALSDEGMSVARAEQKARCSPAGRMKIVVKNKLDGTGKFLTHLRDRVKALDEEKFNQY